MAKRIELPLRDLGCAGGTATTIERALAAVPGVERAYVNPATDTAYLDVEESLFELQLARRALRKVGIADVAAE